MDEGLAGAVGASVDLALGANVASGSGHGHGPAPANCLNCDHPLQPEDNFCSACGQDTANHPPTLMEFAHEFVDHYVAAEGKLWKSLWGLLAKPGYLTVEYLKGRKSRYVLPLRLLLTLGLVFFLSLKLMPSALETLNLEKASDQHGPVARAASAASAIAAEMEADEDEAPSHAASAASAPARAASSTMIGIGLPDEWRPHVPEPLLHRIDKVNAALNKDPKGFVHAMWASALGYAPYAVLCSLPFFAAWLKLLFWRQTYGTHFVFALHLHAAWYGMLLLAVLLPWWFVTMPLWAWSNLYPVLALKRVHAAGWITTLLRAAVLAVLHWLIIGVGFAALLVAGMFAAA